MFNLTDQDGDARDRIPTVRCSPRVVGRPVRWLCSGWKTGWRRHRGRPRGDDLPV